MKPLHAALPASLAVALALAGCAAQRPASGASDAVTARLPTTATGSSQYQGDNGRAGAGVSANAPDNPTGSDAYQSPDLDETGSPYSARAPKHNTGSQQYQH